MKRTVLITALLLWLFAFTPTVLGQRICTCKAADDTCTPRVRCQHGCTALCGSHDACYASCGSIESDHSYARITLKIDRKNSDEIAALLTKHSRRNIKFIPRKKNDLFSVDLKNDPIWKALKLLNKRGVILVDGTRFDQMEKLRRKTSNDEQLSVNFEGVSVANTLAKLSFVSGLPFYVESGDAEQLLSMSIENVTLKEIISRISAKTGVRIASNRKRTAARR